MSQRTKFDRNSLFLEYIASGEDVVDTFLKEKGVLFEWNKRPSWAMKLKTKGRYDQKTEIKRKAMERAVESYEKELANKVYKPSIKDLSALHERVISVCKVALNDMTEKDPKTWQIRINPAFTKVISLRDIWEITKIEKKEPTKYVEDFSPPIQVELTDRQKEILASFKPKLYNEKHW